MARTGISIIVSNTVLGAPPQVNSNSILFVGGSTATSTGTLAFSLKVPYMLRSTDDLETLGITAANNEEIVRQVTDFYYPTSGVDNSGTILWLVGYALTADLNVALILDSVTSTVINGFQYRPRNILVSGAETFTVPSPITQQQLQAAVESLYYEGFATVALVGSALTANVTTGHSTLPDLSTMKSGMVGTVVITDIQGKNTCVGKVGGFMASLTVGTSIGDASLPSFAESMYINDHSSATVIVNTPCSKLTLSTRNSLGDKQYIFAVTRSPRNGLWLNDGATAEDPATALSTLEAGRTIASMVDDLRSFFTPYINNKVPVNSSGDLQSAYKQVVLDNARSTVVSPYIASGDISDARLTMVAKNNDFVGTRTWEVTLAILPAPTLRWVDGYVFYVKSLN